MEKPEVHHSHSNPGFGQNSSGMGLLIVALMAVVIMLGAWWLWNNNHTETEYYRLPAEKTAAHESKSH